MKKITTAIVVAGVSVTLLAGCGSKDKDSTATSGTADASSLVSETVEAVAVVESSSGTDTEVIVEESAMSGTHSMSDDAMSEMSGTAAGDAYVSPDGAYSVAFPTEPTVTGASAVAAGPDGTAYTVTSFPAPNDNLDEAMAQIGQTLGGSPENVKDVEVDGRKGKSFDFAMSSGGATAAGVALLVIDGKTAYFVMAASASGDKASANAFIDSFKLLK